MKNYKKYMGVLLAFTLFSLYLSIERYSSKKEQPSMEYTLNNKYSETLVVVADKDFEPYSFIDKDGNPAGYDIEIIYSLAAALEKNIELKMLPWQKCIQAAKNNEADLILGVVKGSPRTQNIPTSIPTNVDSFVLFGKENYSDFEEIYDKRIAFLMGSESRNLFLNPHKMYKNSKGYSTYGAAFDSVLQGENDYILTTYSVGRRISTKYAGIQAVGQVLVNKMFSIGASEKKADLIEFIDNEIIKRRKDGTLDYLTDKWLGRYVEITSFKDFLKQNSIILNTFVWAILLLIIVMMISDYKKQVAMSKKRERELLECVAKDPLTKIYNRISGEQMAEQIIKDGGPDVQHAFIMIDVDDFKIVNEALGHDGGDEVLIIIAKALKNIFNDFDIPIRMGGDEFSVFAGDYKDFSLIDKKIRKLLKTLNEKIVIKNKEIEISLSIGVATFPENGDDFKTLYHKADEALYLVKSSGKNSYYIYGGIK